MHLEYLTISLSVQQPSVYCAGTVVSVVSLTCANVSVGSVGRAEYMFLEVTTVTRTGSDSGIHQYPVLVMIAD